MNIPSHSQLLATENRIKDYIHRTPVLTSQSLNEIFGCELFFKCENFQRGGSYKIRGAMNAVRSLTEEQLKKGVATHSSGNFAQALAIAAQSCGAKAYIVMPENAPKVKIEAVKGYGGTVILCESTLKAREEQLKEVIESYQATPVHPSNDRDVILGQSTVSSELLEEYPDIEILISPIGGGGVGAGACLAAKYHNAQVDVIGAEPEQADDAYRSLIEGKIMPSVHPKTIADGLRTQLGDQNFPIIKNLIKEIILVSEDSIVDAMRYIWERMKIVVEPSSATTLATILMRPNQFKGKKVGLIITGGNVSLDKLPF